MLSGVGPKKHLQEMDVPLVADLPVGQNLQGRKGRRHFLANRDLALTLILTLTPTLSLTLTLTLTLILTLTLTLTLTLCRPRHGERPYFQLQAGQNTALQSWVPV